MHTERTKRLVHGQGELIVEAHTGRVGLPKRTPSWPAVGRPVVSGRGVRSNKDNMNHGLFSERFVV